MKTLPLSGVLVELHASLIRTCVPFHHAKASWYSDPQSVGQPSSGSQPLTCEVPNILECLRSHPVTVFFGLLHTLAFVIGVPVLAEERVVLSVETVAGKAKATWDSGAVIAALELLDRGIHDHPEAPVLHKLRGDILSTFRDSQEAVQAYDQALAADPTALDTHWAKWGVLVRWGREDEAISELQSIAQIEASNPLIHWRLALELRKLDRLEESLESYKRAVELMPGLLGWRLALARARFDVLDYAGADAALHYVLQHVTPGSPLELPAKNQLAQLYESMDRGRRFKRVLTPEATADQLKEWASLRSDAWKLFEAGRYQEVEPVYRKLLELNPSDPVATQQLGLTLMQLNRCEEALDVFGNMSNLNPKEEDFADTTYRMGQCYVELERWEDAFVHFQILYDAAVEFEEANKGIAFPAGTRVLAKDKIARWLEKVKPHVPELVKLKEEEAKREKELRARTLARSEEAFFAKAIEKVKPQKTLDAGVAIAGRDADFSWFRYVIPSSKVVRDDFPTGAHEFIPLNPSDTFPSTQSEIYLVFKLLSDSFEAVLLTARCAPETREMTEDPQTTVQDRVMTAMNDRSGYFLLTPPKTGWTPGYYRCGLFAGEQTSAYSYVDEVRFRIVGPSRP
ncbi:MAG: tetratricopeptide repeat protein [Nitrospira sp.]|nr:tetratricopeptide repeat protein [Nitrospira sp.]MDH4371121.1 tetratricopeptide repeat protein [Nitrospira sp.]MDH5497781.1 tetratricopeptide repeat protein [Nitrospira sp.]MDH5725385.1 tetratricopeptide repeat protein [Nitrospira sp.]